MLRFVLGVAELTQERVGAVLSACTAAEPAAAGAAAGAPFTVRHAVLGALAGALGGASRASARVRARSSHLTEGARRRAAPLGRARKLLGRLPGTRRALRRLRTWRDGGQKQLARWAELGRSEEAASRVLASDAIAVLRENTIARFSESPDVKQVIREQSEGIAVTAVDGLREGSARADNLAEGAVARFFGRGRSQRTR